jgi:hypothetical protein
MEPIVVFTVLYFSSVVFAAYMTVREQRRSAMSGTGYLMIGILACVVWPVVALACVLSGPSQIGQGA